MAEDLFDESGVGERDPTQAPGGGIRVVPGQPAGVVAPGGPPVAPGATAQYQQQVDGLLNDLRAERKARQDAETLATEREQQIARYRPWEPEIAEYERAYPDMTPQEVRAAVQRDLQARQAGTGGYGAQPTYVGGEPGYRPQQQGIGAQDDPDRPMTRREFEEIRREERSRAEDAANIQRVLTESVREYPTVAHPAFLSFVQSAEERGDKRADSYNGVKELAREFHEGFTKVSAGQTRTDVAAAREAEAARIRGGGSLGATPPPKVNPRNSDQVSHALADFMESRAAAQNQ